MFFTESYEFECVDVRVLVSTFFLKHPPTVLSSMLTASIIISTAVFGTIGGRYLIRRVHMNTYQSTKFILICCFISLIFLILLIFY